MKGDLMTSEAKVELEVEGRQVRVWQLEEGGYRYATTAAADQDPTHQIERGSSTFFPPVTRGQPIEDSVDNLAELKEHLLQAGFSEAVAENICSRAAPHIKR
jgi:hypothetical protein